MIVDLETQTKVCTRCKESKLISEFHKRPILKSGLASHCRNCNSKLCKDYRDQQPLVTEVQNEKFCTKCETIKSSNEFYHIPTRLDGFSHWCIKCTKLIKAKEENKLKERARGLMKRFGLTTEDYESFLKLQNGVCAICEETCTRFDYLSVDHDHKCCPGTKSCGKCIRGLLCNSCNNGLARFKDEPQRLKKAAAYIRGSG